MIYHSVSVGLEVLALRLVWRTSEPTYMQLLGALHQGVSLQVEEAVEEVLREFEVSEGQDCTRVVCDGLLEHARVIHFPNGVCDHFVFVVAADDCIVAGELGNSPPDASWFVPNLVDLKHRLLQTLPQHVGPSDAHEGNVLVES